MLKFSLTKLAFARGIANQYSFLVKNGFSSATAKLLESGEIDYLKLEYLERLSVILNCTPNDLFEWVPNNKSEDKADHPLQPLKKSASINMGKVLKKLPMEKIRELESLLKSI